MKLPSSNEELLKNLETLIAQTYEVEKEFIELKNILNGVIEFLPQALWVIDKKGEIILQNSKAKKFKTIPNEGEIEINSKFYLIQISQIKDKKIISATDITEQKRNERLIAMGQMAAHLAHEIRNPIGSVAILLSILKNDCKKSANIIDEIKSSIFRVEKIIKSTLLYSKGINLKIQQFKLSNLIEELKKSIKFYSHSKNIKFIWNFKDTEIKGDLDLLMLVFQNMIFNAIDAIEESENESGIIEFNFFEDETYNIFEIIDNGIEFKDKQILFEAFKSTKTTGNGLGLALSLEIIKKHKGEISLHPQKKGFIIKIPKTI